MNKLLLEALEAYYKGNIKKAEANLNIYLRNPMGIGEHPDIIEAMDSQVAIIADNVDKLAIITSYQNSRKDMEFII
tara:strand:- start:571 stop:798 length:228 start_codon:yes stop_codon:yes gene_type:complete